jgi:hypothetical protein
MYMYNGFCILRKQKEENIKPKNKYWIIANLECPLSDGPMSKRWSTQFDVFYSYLQDSDITGPTANLELRSEIPEKKIISSFPLSLVPLCFSGWYKSFFIRETATNEFENT